MVYLYLPNVASCKTDYHSWRWQLFCYVFVFWKGKLNSRFSIDYVREMQKKKSGWKKWKCFIFVFRIFYLTYILQLHFLNFWCINFQTLVFVDCNLIVEGSFLFCHATPYKDWDIFFWANNCEQRQYEGRNKTNPKPKMHILNLYRHLVHSSLFAIFHCAVLVKKAKV